VLVENRAGAAGTIGADFVAKAPGDGYTLLMGHVNSNAIAPNVYKRMPYDTLKDLSMVLYVGYVPNVLVLHPSLPAKSVKELITLARKRPGEIAYASSGSGSPEHLAGEMFAMMAGVKMLHVPFKGGAPSAAAIVGGEVVVGFNTMPVALPHIQSGRMRVLATTEERRAGVLPQVPTIAEAGVPGYAASTWYGAMLPTGTPREIVLRLNAEINIAEYRPGNAPENHVSKIPGVHKFENVTLKRGIVDSAAFWDWMRAAYGDPAVDWAAGVVTNIVFSNGLYDPWSSGGL
jgi:tripartite-type tricarboxylate transporter receptor subunit TctC